MALMGVSVPSPHIESTNSMIYNSFCQQAITDSTYSTRYIYTPDSVVCFVNNFYVSYKASPLLMTVAVVSLPPHDHSYWPL